MSTIRFLFLFSILSCMVASLTYSPAPRDLLFESFLSQVTDAETVAMATPYLREYDKVLNGYILGLFSFDTKDALFCLWQGPKNFMAVANLAQAYANSGYDSDILTALVDTAYPLMDYCNIFGSGMIGLTLFYSGNTLSKSWIRVPLFIYIVLMFLNDAVTYIRWAGYFTSHNMDTHSTAFLVGRIQSDMFLVAAWNAL